MRYRSYNKELMSSTAQVLDVFNDIIIDRRDPENNIQQSFKVACVYGSRSRIIKSLENRSNTLVLPIIVVSMKGLSRDNSRVFGVHDGLRYQDGTGTYNYKKNTPVPIDITYEISIITKFQEDADQILSNFVPFFNPDVYVVMPNPVNTSQNLKCQVLWNGNFTLTHPDEITKDSPARIVSTTTFTLKAWMFQGMGNDDTVGKQILKINLDPRLQWEDGIGRISNWHAVPTLTSFDTYIENMICGFILSGYFDELPISAGVSGYWRDLSGILTGTIAGSGEETSAAPTLPITHDSISGSGTRYRSYNKEVMNSTAQFINLFNDITIDRRNPDNNVQQTFEVGCVYGQRSRIIKSLENRGNTVVLPLITVNMKGLARDNSRVFGVHDGLLYQDGSGTYNYKKNTAVPIDITYELSIITKFQEDMDQIISNFVPFFNPDVYVVMRNPVNTSSTIKCQVVWNGEINIIFPDDIAKESPARIVGTTSFTLKTWMFPGMGNDDTVGKQILRINFNPCLQWEDGIGRISNWYAVPMLTSFETYLDHIICGLIMPDYYDELQISAGLSGYWHDISGAITGINLGDHSEELSADPCFLVTDEGGLLIISKHGYISRGMAVIGSEGYWDYYLSTLTGDLSGYDSCGPTSAD